MVTHEDVRRIARSLPGAEERASYGGRPSWRTPQRMFAWIRDDPEALVVWVDSVEEKEALVASEPDIFFTTPHYDGHPMVLVHLDVIDFEEAAELITESWRLRAPRRLVERFDTEQAGQHRALVGSDRMLPSGSRPGHQLRLDLGPVQQPVGGGGHAAVAGHLTAPADPGRAATRQHWSPPRKPSIEARHQMSLRHSRRHPTGSCS